MIASLILSMLLAPAGPPADARLVQAVKSGNNAVVTSLLQQRVDVNASEADGTTALHYAVQNDDVALVDRLLRAGADVKVKNRYHVTPMYLAAVNGSAAMIERLLKAGADPNATANEGETALMTAARTGKVDAAKVLLAAGAKVDAKEDWHGQTALMWAVAQKHSEMARFLIVNGADPNARSTINKWERQSSAEPREKWLPLGGLPPLHFAARHGCVACVPVLIEGGADRNAVDQDGISAMLMAIINGHYDVASIMIKHGVDVNIADRTGRTALYSAVDFHTMPESNRPSPKEIDNEISSYDLIVSLVAAGANINAQLRQQQPYRTKLDRGDDTMLTTGTTPLLRAAKAGDVPAMRILLELGADVRLATRNGISPLMAAAGLGTREEDTTGRHKTQAEAIEAIQLCIEAGADVNAANTQGQTALHGAALQGYDQVVEFLAQHGAKLDVKDRQGRTPLDAAMGLAGGLGFDGASSVVHESTVAMLKRLMTN